MSFFNPAIRAARAVPPISRLRACPICIFNGSKNPAFYARSLTTSSKSTPPEQHQLETEYHAYYKKRFAYSAAGLAASVAAIWYIITSVGLLPKDIKLDSPLSDDIPVDKRRDDPLVAIGKERKAVVQRLGEDPDDEGDVVQTGTTTVPFFPKLLGFVNEGVALGAGTTQDGLVEYQLIGLGIRTVTFLGIQVYVVGMYVATDDIAALQQALIRLIDPIATTLVAGEKEKLKSVLLHPEQSDEVWNRVLKDTGVRTILRIVPTKDTDFGHLRDGWVRAITARARKEPAEFGDETFGAAVNNFKALFRKGSVPKKKELLLARNEKGVLLVWYDDDKNGSQKLGQAQDERISRAIWLNYLAGKKVASETARLSIVEGVMEFVERPVGTVATQIHV